MFSNPTSDFSNKIDIQVILHRAQSSLITESDHYTLVLLKHRGSIQLNFDTHTLSGNYLLFLCPNEVMEISNYEQLITIALTEHKDIKNITGFNHAYGNIDKFFNLSDGSYDQLERLASHMKDLYENRPINWKEKAFVLLREIFSSSPSYSDELNSKDHSILYDFISLVHEHYTMHHQMSYYAKLLKTPTKSISEKFNSLGVMNPHSFIKQRIVTEAKRQLLYTHKNVKTICFDIGFNDPAYFARFFKKNTGMTTKEFRAQYKQIV